MVRVTYRKKTTLVDPENEPAHAEALIYIWESSKLEVDEDEIGNIIQWRKLGFESEDVVQEFGEVGVLGLDCLVCFLFLLVPNFKHITLSEKVCRERSGFFQGEETLVHIFKISTER